MDRAAQQISLDKVERGERGALARVFVTKRARNFILGNCSGNNILTVLSRKVFLFIINFFFSFFLFFYNLIFYKMMIFVDLHIHIYIYI